MEIRISRRNAFDHTREVDTHDERDAEVVVSRSTNL
jgi:hypothetical protein